MTDKTTKAIRKLKGLEANQERVHYIQIGGRHNGQKLYFKNPKNALAMYELISGSYPIILDDLNIYGWDYKEIEKELDNENLKFRYIDDAPEITLGSEVFELYPTLKDAEKAKDEKEKELQMRVQISKKKKGKK